MPHHADHKQGTEQIRRVVNRYTYRDDEQQNNRDSRHSPSSSQMMEKIISFCASRKETQLLDGLPEAFSEMPPEPMAYRDCSV